MITYYWEYGLDETYGTRTTAHTASEGSINVGSSETITGLTPNTLYHCRLVASNNAGTTYGSDRVFTTTTSGTTTLSKPTIASETVSPLDTFAYVTATIDPKLADTNWNISYGGVSTAVSYSIRQDDTFTGRVIGGDTKVRFKATEYKKTSGEPIEGFLTDGWKVKIIGTLSGNDNNNLEGRTFTVGGSQDFYASGFELINNNGQVVTPSQNAHYQFLVAAMSKDNSLVRVTNMKYDPLTNTQLWPGPIVGGILPSPPIGTPVRFKFDDDSIPVQSNLQGQLYVVGFTSSGGGIRNYGFLRVATSPTGGFITADNNIFPVDENTHFITYNDPPISGATPVRSILAAAGATAVAEYIDDLVPSSNYYYQITASNLVGTATSAVHNFSTVAPLNWASQNLESITLGVSPDPLTGVVNSGILTLGTSRYVNHPGSAGYQDLESMSTGTTSSLTGAADSGSDPVLGSTTLGTARFI